MIHIIGIKRIIILAVLLGVNVALGCMIYLYAMPESTKTEREIRGLRGRVSTIQADIDRMQLEFEQLDRQQESFDALKASGFFNLQDRSNARDIMKAIQEEAKVISAKASIKSGFVEQNAEAEKANHLILISPVEITINAFDDTDVYRYLEIARLKFPGALTLERLEMRRTQEVNGPILRAIAGGANPELVEAKLYMYWRTMVPKNAITDQQEGAQ